MSTPPRPPVVRGGRAASPPAPPTLLADSGVENRNRSMDALVDAGLLRLVLARTDICSSNSLIEAWWRSLKRRWLFLHALDSAARVETLVAFYVAEHNARLAANRAAACLMPRGNRISRPKRRTP